MLKHLANPAWLNEEKGTLFQNDLAFAFASWTFGIGRTTGTAHGLEEARFVILLSYNNF